MEYRGKKIVVMGLGGYRDGSGITAALYFAKSGAKEVLVTDLKSEDELREQIKRLKKFKNVRFVFGKHREKDFEKADIVFQNPSVPDSSPYLSIARKNGTPIMNDWSAFLEKNGNFLIGVTGTRGKSTTTALIYEIIKNASKRKVFLCGNIGVSPLKYADQIKKDDVVVAELSSWLLRGFRAVKKSPNIAVLTNLLKDHLDKYDSLEAYYKDKENIFLFQKKKDVLVANKDDAEVRKRVAKAKAKIIWFSLKPFLRYDGSYIKNGKIYFRSGGREEFVAYAKDVRIKGEANLQNALAAVTAAMAFGAGVRSVRSALKSFNGLPGRLELAASKNGAAFYNDTTSTTPDAAISALKTLWDKKKRIILIAGGQDKKLDFKEFAKEVKKTVKEIILLKGSASEKIKDELQKIKIGFSEVSSMREAVKVALSSAKRGDVILLSPAAASFGMFKNEYDRGDQFNREVRNILRKK
ncbi:MAG: UDP-N-acetylmuramoyl-L-alanine--D-glutamate ligase [Patescibacteria group bacterium]|nr:UDP-N-acetylmuramoyl-L-alanine--D-glutamate ligase [Patescibacteria group bacterium]